MTIILQRRILKRTEEILSESQTVFRSERATTDQIFTLRQIAEKYFGKGQEPILLLHWLKESIWHSLAGRLVKGDGVLWISLQTNHTPASTQQPIPECSQGKQWGHRVVQNSSWSQTRMCHLPQLFNILLELVMLMALDDVQIGPCMQGPIWTSWPWMTSK